MKNIYLSLIALPFITLALPAQGAELKITTGVQACKTAADCTLVTNNCADNCAFIPVSNANLGAAQAMYQARCNKPMDANPKCTMNPPLAAACINARCTIDYAAMGNADKKDYQSGAYPVPEAATPSKVQGDYSKVDDTKGNFNAYDLPQDTVKQKTVGQIIDRVYVPSSAPVSGGNYVPVDNGAAKQAVPSAPAPSQQNYRDELNVGPSDTTPQIPSPGLPPAPRAAKLDDEAPAPIPQVGASGIPRAPTGSTPIPPSDLKPAPTFVPPAGTAVPVAPEDPGAPPPAGSSISIMPSTPEEAAAMKKADDAATSFARTGEKKTGYSLNN